MFLSSSSQIDQITRPHTCSLNSLRHHFGCIRIRQASFSLGPVRRPSHPCSVRRRHLRILSSGSDQQEGSDPAEVLLAQLQPYEVEQPGPLEPDWTPTASGESIRGVVATGSYSAGSTILSVPAPLVLTDIGHDKSGDLPWSGYMAVKLFEKLAACSHKNASPEDLTCTWLNSLPKEVMLAAGGCQCSMMSA